MSRPLLRRVLECLEDRSVPAVAFALSNNTLIPFDTTNSINALPAITITGRADGDTLVGIDFRPQNGMLYGLGHNPGAGTVRLYSISPRTGVATAVGAPISGVLGSNFGFDFNPAVDLIRVVTDAGQNYRLNPNTGDLVAFDGPIGGGTTSADAAAYTNNEPNATVTTLYVLDSSTNKLFIQNPPNDGTETNGVTVNVNGTKLAFTAANGFDIPAGVSVTTNNAAATGLGFAALTVGVQTSLFSIDLTNGSAVNLGTIAGGTVPVQGLAVWSDLGGIPAIAVSADGTQLLRSTGGPITVVAVTGLVVGERLVGLDWRPANGQLFGLGFNPNNGSGSATLYRLDPQTGAAAVVGIPGGVANGSGAPISLAGASAFGFDFNPVADAIRVVTNNGLNFRVSPSTGAVVGGALDPNINGGATGASGAAYTNAFGGATATTLYTLNPGPNTLSIQSPPNSGTQTQTVPVTLNGVTLDFDAVLGFDIPPGVTVATSNATAAGLGYAVLTVGGSTGLYTINLSNGVASLLQATVSSAGLTLGDSPPGAIAFAGTSATANEGGTYTLTLSRIGGSVGALTASIQVVGGTAVAGADYNGVPATVTFADGQTAASIIISLPINPNSSGDRNLILRLADPSGGAVFATPNQFALTITDPTANPVLVGYPQFGAGQDVGGGTATVYNPDRTVLFSLDPFEGFTGGVRVAVADVNGDGVPDLIVGTGPGTTARVRVIDGKTKTELENFEPFGADFTGGVFVAAGDINRDGFADIVISPDVSGGPRVRVFSGKNFAPLADFFGIEDPEFRGGVRVAVGDVNGDGFADLAVAAGEGGGPRVALYSGATIQLGVQPNRLLPDFFAFEPELRNGVYVALGDINGDGFADIVVGGGPTGGPRVQIFDGAKALAAGAVDPAVNPGLVMANFFAGDPNNRAGIRIAIKDLDGDQFADLITGPGEKSGSLLAAYLGQNLRANNPLVAFQFNAYPDDFGLYVG